MFHKPRDFRVGAMVVMSVLTIAACSSTAPDPTPEVTPVIADAAVNDARYQCLLDQGLPVTRTEDGAVQFSDPTGTLGDRWDEAQAFCEQQLVDAGLVEAVTDESLRAEYARLSALHACLVEHEFPVVTWPSESVYVEAKGAFNALEATVPIDLDEVRSACPDEMITIESS